MRYGAASDSASNLLRCAGVTGTLQAFASTGQAFDVTKASGEKIRFSISAASRVRFAPGSNAGAPATTFDASTSDVSWGTGDAALDGVPTGGILLDAGVYERDVPFMSGADVGVYLVVTPGSGTTDVVIEKA